MINLYDNLLPHFVDQKREMIPHMYYFFSVKIKYQDHRQFKKEFISANSSKGLESIMAGKAQHGSKSRKMTDYILYVHRKQKARRNIAGNQLDTKCPETCAYGRHFTFKTLYLFFKNEVLS